VGLNSLLGFFKVHLGSFFFWSCRCIHPLVKGGPLRAQ
jgi:hypothetical protein